MIRVLADTSFLIAAIRTSDAMHIRAKEIYKEEFQFIIPIFVFQELITFLENKTGKNFAYQEAHKLLNSDAIAIEFRNEDIVPTLEILRRYEGLSYCDAANVLVMKELGITNILSFDSDFDLIPGIERIY